MFDFYEYSNPKHGIKLHYSRRYPGVRFKIFLFNIGVTLRFGVNKIFDYTFYNFRGEK